MAAFIDYSRKGARAKAAAGDSDSPPLNSGDSSSATTASTPETSVEAVAATTDIGDSGKDVTGAGNPARRKSVAFVETETASRAPSGEGGSADEELQQTEAHRGVLVRLLKIQLGLLLH